MSNSLKLSVLNRIYCTLRAISSFETSYTPNLLSTKINTALPLGFFYQESGILDLNVELSLLHYL